MRKYWLGLFWLWLWMGWPALGWSNPTEYRLPAPVAAALAREALPPSSLSLYVHPLDGDEASLALRADQPRNPASTMKLVTTLAALNLLGPTYRWKTRVYTMALPDDGTLDGDLYIKGSGNPFLVYERVWKLLRRVRERGIRRITGDLVLDASRFRLSGFDPGAFDGKPHRAYNVGPDALLMNFHAVSLTLTRSLDGKGLELLVEPPLAGLKVDNTVTLASGRCRGRLNVRFEAGAVARADELPELRLSGRFPGRCARYSMLRAAGRSPGYAFALTRKLWAELGGSLDGGVRREQVPPGAILVAELESPPLSDLIRSINKFSNNVMARNLLLTLGAELKGAPSTLEKSRSAVLDWLNAAGLPTTDFYIDNGAGLSRDAQLTARFLGQLLVHAYRDPLMSEFVSSLALSGLDGSMRRRFDDDPLTGQAHLKTGLLHDVRSIAGYVHAQDGRSFVVVALQSYPEVHQGAGTRVQDALLEWIYASPKADETRACPSCPT